MLACAVQDMGGERLQKDDVPCEAQCEASETLLFGGFIVVMAHLRSKLQLIIYIRDAVDWRMQSTRLRERERETEREGEAQMTTLTTQSIWPV